MPRAITILTLFSALSFIFYGMSCLTSSRMASEFERFGLSKNQRNLTGIFQLIGGGGLALGFYISATLAAISAFGPCRPYAIGVRCSVEDQGFCCVFCSCIDVRALKPVFGASFFSSIVICLDNKKFTVSNLRYHKCCMDSVLNDLFTAIQNTYCFMVYLFTALHFIKQTIFNMAYLKVNRLS